ncbi:conserved exported hypothetical protein [Aeromicrobium sp. 9AM]|nr:conserved exported hypothetical protein [Aeromicrobium sp. 9AM]
MVSVEILPLLMMVPVSGSAAEACSAITGAAANVASAASRAMPLRKMFTVLPSPGCRAIALLRVGSSFAGRVRNGPLANAMLERVERGRGPSNRVPVNITNAAVLIRMRTAVRACWSVDLYTQCGGEMPSRRHNRAGARDGIISAELQAALLRECHQLGSIVEAVERVQALNDFFAQLDFELEQFADVRLDAVAELRGRGWSYDRIASETKLSKSRVAQLSRAARRAP